MPYKFLGNDVTEKICPRCQKQFKSDNKKRIYCSKFCCIKAWEQGENKKLAIAAYAKSHPEMRKAIKLKHYYNMTLDQYYKMKNDQNGVCAICFGICKTGRDLAVDHDHKTGKIRGLLCHNCNNILGSANDSFEVLINAIKYLRERN